jgi:hypothetical protein
MIVSENRLPLFGITLAGENASAETISPARRCGQETTLDLAFDAIGQSAAVIADIARNLSIGLTLARLDHGVEKAPQRDFDRAVISGSAVMKSTATSGILSKEWRTRFGLGGVAPRAPGRQGEIGLSEIS